MEAFGELLRRLRTQRGMTLESLADKTNLSYVAIGDWERGKRNPRRANVEIVAEALEVDAREMLTAAGFMPTASELTREQNEDDARFYADYNGIETPASKEILRRMAETLRQSERNASTGGRDK